MPEPQLSIQALVVLGGVAGGVITIGNAAIKLAEKVIDSKRNGNGKNGIIHEDVKMIHSDLKAVGTQMNDLTRAADGFKRSHETLKELAIEHVTSNRKFHAQFAIYLERFATHMQDMKCLRKED